MARCGRGGSARPRRGRPRRRPRGRGRPAFPAPRSWPEEREELAWIEGARRRDEVTHHEAHGRTLARPRCEAPGRVLEERGTGQERLDQPGDRVLRGEPAAHRAYEGVGRVA